MNARPRRALPPEEDELRAPRRGSRTLLVSCLLSAAVVLVAYVVWGPRTTTQTATPSTPAASATDSPSPTPPTPTQTVPPPSSVTTDAVPTTATPAPPPSTGTPDPTAVTSAPPEEEPPLTAPPAGHIQIDDTSFTAPEGWVLYGDDLIEDGRRVVRLSHTATDARLQAVSLPVQDADLGSSCADLMETQGDQFNLSAENLALPIGIDASQGQGVTCGFSGIRLSDEVANTVTFTLVRRGVDGNVLMLRHTVPDDVPPGDPARRHLAAMSCEASSGFGTPLPLC